MVTLALAATDAGALQSRIDVHARSRSRSDAELPRLENEIKRGTEAQLSLSDVEEARRDLDKLGPQLRARLRSCADFYACLKYVASGGSKSQSSCKCCSSVKKCDCRLQRQAQSRHNQNI